MFILDICFNDVTLDIFKTSFMLKNNKKNYSEGHPKLSSNKIGVSTSRALRIRRVPTKVIRHNYQLFTFVHTVN